ncbi:transketolase [Candidatus Beckwithbacteria bacterium]|nr:transketolase [Candidatus Beckwithbacteria bacterium]
MKPAQLALAANLIRQDIITMLAKAGSGHPAGSLGIADILVYLYSDFLYYNPLNSSWPERDRLVLSAGHLCPALYATLADFGYFDKGELSTLRQINSRLQGHPHVGDLPGIENSSGPLGQGVSVAVGLALAAKKDRKPWRVVCISSDGEQQEGQVWEAYLLAAKYKLDNLIFIIDRNDIQIGGSISQVLPLEPLLKKYRAFGLEAVTVNGHNFTQIDKKIKELVSKKGRPKLLLAKTVPGKGVSFMEHDFAWHGKTPNQEEAKKALQELRALEKKLKKNV